MSETEYQKSKILIIDDEPFIIDIISDLLFEEGYKIFSANNGPDGIIKAYENKVDLILLDVNMPGMNGFETCRILRNAENTSDIPVIFLTGLKDRQSRIDGLDAGANDFLTKPVDSVEMKLRIRNMLSLRSYWHMVKDYNLVLEKEVERKTAELRTAFDQLNVANRKIKEGYIDTIFRLSLAAEYKDPDTANHLLRISKLSSFFARQIGLEKRIVEDIFFASPMHDIGKIAIPDSIIFKPAPLSVNEYNKMQSHTVIGQKMLQGSDSHIIKIAEKIAGSHHEKYNGTGYPNGLREDEIPVEGQIVMIIDVYDALRSVRPYKKGFSHDEAINIIYNGDGRVNRDDFNPVFREAFLDNHEEIRQIFETVSIHTDTFETYVSSKDYSSFSHDDLELKDYRR